MSPLPILRYFSDVRSMHIDRRLAGADQMQPGADSGPLETIYFAHQGNTAHKWHHYLPLYDRYFAPFRNRTAPLRMLEIGVSGGGSLELWRNYFGPEAIIYGIDINPDCAKFDGIGGNKVRIGSQADARFLTNIVHEMGGLDIVLDDGSHIASHMRKSFDILFPLLADGGIYVAEDVSCAYWTKFGGGYRRSGTFIEMTKTLIDDVHHWWHRKGEKIAAARGKISGIHVHSSFIVFEKNDVQSPINSRVGTKRTPTVRGSNG